MLKFNHGRFELEQLSFCVPDNLYLTSVGEMQIENGFELFTEDKKIHMVVAGNDVAENARESIESIFDEEDNFKKLSEIVEIERAGLDGYSVTYEDSKAYHLEVCLNTPMLSECPTFMVWGRTERKNGEEGVALVKTLCNQILESIRVSA